MTWSNVQTTGWNGAGSDVSGGRQFTGNGTGSGYNIVACSLRQTFDLSNYRYIKITVTKQLDDNAFGFIAISSQYGLDGSGKFIAYSEGPSVGTTILDVSNINGSYYIYVGMKFVYYSWMQAWRSTITQLYLTNN